MIKEIVTDIKELSKPCLPCFKDEINTYTLNKIEEDLKDTIKEHKNTCVGLSSNQIGYNKRMIIAKIHGVFITMLNPHYIPVKTSGIKRSSEKCLSLPDQPTSYVRRYKKINLTYQKITGKTIKITLIKDAAYIVQHEVDHLNGKLI